MLGYWGCLAPLFIAGLVALFTSIPGVDFSWILLIPAILVVAAGVYADVAKQAKMIGKKWDAEVAQQQARLVRDATDATRTANERLVRGARLVGSMRAHLDTANHALALAEHEFADRAFAPFWDAIETSATAIYSFREDVDQFEREALLYAQILSNRQHNFPAWPGALSPVPDHRDTLSRFRAQVRKGQTDRDFAIILEHRLTRAVLIAGFRNFGEVLSGLERSLSASLERLRRTIALE
jgi:hypothetical protein